MSNDSINESHAVCISKPLVFHQVQYDGEGIDKGRDLVPPFRIPISLFRQYVGYADVRMRMLERNEVPKSHRHAIYISGFQKATAEDTRDVFVQRSQCRNDGSRNQQD